MEEDKIVDITPIYKKYKGKWVALGDDDITVISVGTNATKVLKDAQKKGFEKPLLIKVPLSIMPMAG